MPRPAIDTLEPNKELSMKYNINGYCFEHGGEMNETATSRAEADAKFTKMKDSILHHLKVGKDSCAKVQMSSSKKHIKTVRVSHP